MFVSLGYILLLMYKVPQFWRYMMSFALLAVLLVLIKIFKLQGVGTGFGIGILFCICVKKDLPNFDNDNSTDDIEY